VVVARAVELAPDVGEAGVQNDEQLGIVLDKSLIGAQAVAVEIFKLAPD
jgi:hypothetical protein